MQTMKWGLVPHWAKFEDKSLNTTNARSENLVEGGGMWGSIKGRKRCAIPCEGYYEWLKKGKDRLPHFTKHKNGNMMLLAGLYDTVILEGQSEPLWTFTIVTTSANKDFSWLHDRQPVILSTDEALFKWLDTSSQTWTPELTKLVNPYSDQQSPLECYQVPKEVGKVGTESSTFIQPIAARKDGIQAMFAKQRSKTNSPSTSALKRKRTSAVPNNGQVSDEDVLVSEPDSSQSKAKAQKLNAWEDTSDVEYVGQRREDPARLTINPLHAEMKSPPKVSDKSPPTSATKDTKAQGKGKGVDKGSGSVNLSSGKITSFFTPRS